MALSVCFLLVSFTPPEEAGDIIQTTFAEVINVEDVSLLGKTVQFSARWGRVSHPSYEELFYDVNNETYPISLPNFIPVVLYDENMRKKGYFWTDEPDKFLFLRELTEGTKMTVTAYRVVKKIVDQVFLYNIVTDIKVIESESKQEEKILNTDYDTVVQEVFKEPDKYLNTKISFSAIYDEEIEETMTERIKYAKFRFLPGPDGTISDAAFFSFWFPQDEQLESLLSKKEKKSNVKITIRIKKVPIDDYRYNKDLSSWRANTYLLEDNDRDMLTHPIYGGCKYVPYLIAVDGVSQNDIEGKYNGRIKGKFVK